MPAALETVSTGTKGSVVAGGIAQRESCYKLFRRHRTRIDFHALARAISAAPNA
jgi:hypothetical protein